MQLDIVNESHIYDCLSSVCRIWCLFPLSRFAVRISRQGAWHTTYLKQIWLWSVLTVKFDMQMYNKQKEIEALEKRQALSKEQLEEDDAQSAAPARQNGASQQDQAYSNAAANGGLYRAPSHGAAPALAPAAPVDPIAEVLCSS